MRSSFHGPVQQVAGQSIHNNHYHQTEPGPDDHDHMARKCPQCGRRTWMLNRHCYHCRMDLRAYDRRLRLIAISKRAGIWLVGAAIVLTIAAQPLQAAEANSAKVSKAAALQLARDIDGAQLGLFLMLTKPPAGATASLSRRANALFGSPVLNQPFAACVQAANFADDVKSDARAMLASGKAPDAARISSLARASYLQGDAYRRCRVEIDAMKD